MKKIFSLVIALCGMLTLSGCMIEEVLDFAVPGFSPENSPITDEMKEFYFESLSGEEPFVVIREPNSLAIKTPGYPNKYIAVAVYERDCEVCQAQAPYLDKIAKEFPQYGIDVIIVFSDIMNDSANKEVEWIKDLSYVKAYTNLASACSENGACQEVFFPFGEGMVGNVYYINKVNVLNKLNFFAWNTAGDPEKEYQNMRQSIANHLGLKEIQFDPPTVGGWNDQNIEK